ncbi:MAG: Asp-tRNA(Asn)/Glu-tRNA(Gln) amidotransferase subunit GatC [Dehalococcoidia bacterium]|nr:Asp-tRNA(Asn)/Glu-tRNA(Gln) amidotransferase subunit GatC [Dehalococcoidia bacterium]
MALTREEVLHIARLARVGLTEDDVTKFQQQLSQILDHFDALSRIDTEGVPPTTHTLALEGVMAADEPQPSLPRDAVLANAPVEQDGHLRVRAVLEDT